MKLRQWMIHELFQPRARLRWHLTALATTTTASITWYTASQHQTAHAMKDEGSKNSLHTIRNMDKEKVFGEYENRIRAHSAPEKIFEYFASVHDGTTRESFMLPSDILRALIPYNPYIASNSKVHQTGSNNVDFQFSAMKRKPTKETRSRYKELLKEIWENGSAKAFEQAKKMRSNAEDGNQEKLLNAIDVSTHVTCLSELGVSIGNFHKKVKQCFGEEADLIYLEKRIHRKLTDLLDQDEDGLIGYGEFILLLGILSIKRSRAMTFFKVLDSNGDGKLDQVEFQKLLDAIRCQTSFGQQMATAGDDPVAKTMHRWKLFFAEDDGKVSPETFCSLIEDVKDIILWEEFKSYDVGNKDYLTPTEFAFFVVNYATKDTRDKYCQRISRLPAKMEHGKVTFEEIKYFHQLMERSDLFYNSLKLLLRFKNKPNADALTLQKASAAAFAGDQEATKEVHSLNIMQTHTLVALFDENNDGQISCEELILAMQKKSNAYLDKPRQGRLISESFHRIKRYLTERLE